jgi:ABC-2 type transport system permease protein
MTSAISLIIGREYMERVKRKSFIITTLLMPVLMIVLMALPTLIIMFSSPESKHIAIVDESGVIGSQLKSNDDLTFTLTDKKFQEVVTDEDFDGVLLIGKDVVSNPKAVTLYTRDASSVQTDEVITGQVEDAIENERIKAYNIENLQQILNEVHVDVDMSTYRLNEDEEATATSSMVSYAVGTIMMFMLYMFILLYGQMVMTSIIEEKNNRVLELVISSAKPFDLMLGKIVGVALVAVTQVLIWAVIVCSFSAFVMPSLITGVMSGADGSMSEVIGQFGDVTYVIGLFVDMLIYLIGGYLIYAAIFAAIGSAVDNVQDASQLQTIAVVPILAGLVISMAVVADPNSSMAVWGSIIPFTSPMVMMARIPFGVPFWQLALSIALLYVGIIFVIWFAAKVYRVGIFMYGKKPTIAELIRWTRYK